MTERKRDGETNPPPPGTIHPDIVLGGVITKPRVGRIVAALDAFHPDIVLGGVITKPRVGRIVAALDALRLVDRELLSLDKKDRDYERYV